MLPSWALEPRVPCLGSVGFKQGVIKSRTTCTSTGVGVRAAERPPLLCHRAASARGSLPSGCWRSRRRSKLLPRSHHPPRPAASRCQRRVRPRKVNGDQTVLQAASRSPSALPCEGTHGLMGAFHDAMPYLGAYYACSAQQQCGQCLHSPRSHAYASRRYRSSVGLLL